MPSYKYLGARPAVASLPSRTTTPPWMMRQAAAFAHAHRTARRMKAHADLLRGFMRVAAPARWGGMVGLVVARGWRPLLQQLADSVVACARCVFESRAVIAVGVLQVRAQADQ